MYNTRITSSYLTGLICVICGWISAAFLCEDLEKKVGDNGLAAYSFGINYKPVEPFKRQFPEQSRGPLLVSPVIASSEPPIP